MALLHCFIAQGMRREDGQALVEYGLIIALIALAAMVGLTAAGGSVDGLYGTFDTISDAISGGVGG